MSPSRFVASLVAVVFVLSGLFAGALAPSANAVGAEVYRTDQWGRKTGTVFGVGNTGSSAFCMWLGVGAVRHGVAICYLPL